MNIHIEDDTLKQELFNSELLRIPFGSHVYGLNNENSDEDFICIYAESYIERNSFLWEHHNFQIKENNTDFIFTSLNNFIRNLMNGDMPGNLESIWLPEMEQSLLSYLYDIREEFISYANIRSFLGYAKRDLKHSLRDDSRLCHAYRSVISAKKLLSGTFNPYCNTWKEYDILKDMKEGKLSLSEKRQYCGNMEQVVHDLRVSINESLESGRMNRFMDINEMAKLDEWLLDITASSWYTDKANVVSGNNHKYQALENGIKY